MKHYILNPDHTIKIVGMFEWGEWMEHRDRIVKQTFLDPITKKKYVEAFKCPNCGGDSYEQTMESLIKCDYCQTILIQADKGKHKDAILISTVFLGIDYGFRETGDPILFETMIFGGKEDGYCDRYATWDEAVIGHKKAVKIVKGEITDV